MNLRYDGCYSCMRNMECNRRNRNGTMCYGCLEEDQMGFDDICERELEIAIEEERNEFYHDWWLYVREFED